MGRRKRRAEEGQYSKENEGKRKRGSDEEKRREVGRKDGKERLNGGAGEGNRRERC